MADEVAFPEDWPLHEGQFRLPDGRIAFEVPDEHSERVEFVLKKYDARHYLSILAKARDALSDPESLWSRIAALANTERRRHIAAACTIREQVWAEYSRGEIEWEAMAEELERRWEKAWDSIKCESYEDLLKEACEDDRHLYLMTSDHLNDEVPHAVNFALGIHYPRIPMMAEIPNPRVDA